MAYRKTNVVSRKQTGTGLPHSGTETGRGEGGGGGEAGKRRVFGTDTQHSLSYLFGFAFMAVGTD